MADLFNEGDHVFYRGHHFAWGHAVVKHVSDAGYVLVLDHCGEVVVGLDEVSALPQSNQPRQSPTATKAASAEQPPTASTTQRALS